MSAEVEKQDKFFSVKIKSDRIICTIDGLNESELLSLRAEIDKLLVKPKKTKTVWNPRAQRHEEVADE